MQWQTTSFIEHLGRLQDHSPNFVWQNIENRELSSSEYGKDGYFLEDQNPCI